MLLRIWTRVRAHIWAYVSTIFLATCVGALGLAIAGPASYPSVAELFAAAQPSTIHIGGLTMRVYGSEIPEPSAVDDTSKRASFDLSLQIPEFGQSGDAKAANPSGLEWQTQISMALYTAKAAPRAGTVRIGQNDPSVSTGPVPIAAFNQDTFKNVAAFGKCLAPSQDGSCSGWISLGNGFILRYASSRVLAHTPDFKDRVTQVAALLGFSNHLMALPGVTKTPDHAEPEVEVASLPKSSRWRHER